MVYSQQGHPMIETSTIHKVINRRLRYASVEISLEAEGSTSIVFKTTGNGYSPQGCVVDASESGYEDWKTGARDGVMFALQYARKTAKVEVLRISGLLTDTNPTDVSIASAIAVFKILKYNLFDYEKLAFDYFLGLENKVCKNCNTKESEVKREVVDKFVTITSSCKCKSRGSVEVEEIKNNH